MIRKNHTRNQRRMYRIHKQEERIQDLELLVGELRQEYNKVQKMYEETFADYQKQKEVINKAIDFIENGDLLYLATKNSLVYRNNIEVRAVADRLNDLLQILEDKEVSE